MSISKTTIFFCWLSHVAPKGRMTSYNKSWHNVRCHTRNFLNELALKISIKQLCDWLFETYPMWNVNEDSSVLGCNTLFGRAVLTVQRTVVPWSSGSSSLHSTWTAWPWRWRHYFPSEHWETLIRWQCHNPKDLAPQQHRCKCPASNYDAWWDTMTYAHTFQMGGKREIFTEFEWGKFLKWDHLND